MAKSRKSKSRPKAKKKDHPETTEGAAEAQENLDPIVIDEGAGLIFESEEALHAYFEKGIDKLTKEYADLRNEDDFIDDEQIALESHLDEVLDHPDEVWQDTSILKNHPLHIFIKKFSLEAEFYYVAITYVSSDDQNPSFVLFHFPTKHEGTLKHYQRGELVFDKRIEKVQLGALEGDALGEGDSLSLGLYEAMLTLRSDKDLAEEKFKDFKDLREETIEQPDEIWRKTDHDGNILVCFIKEFPDHSPADLHYVAMTQEDSQSGVHALLFSFPTTDKSLLDRYRQGENLQAEEVVQESSH